MKIEWGYLWRTAVFHSLWVILSPLAALISAGRSRSIFQVKERMRMVYESVYKKFVVRPQLTYLGDISDTDLDTLVWLSQGYPFSLHEVAEIWESQGRMLGATIQHIEARMIGMRVKLKK